MGARQSQRLESSNGNPESTVWNPGSKTVLDSLPWGERMHTCVFSKRGLVWACTIVLNCKICRSCSHIYIICPDCCGFSECSNHVDSE